MNKLLAAAVFALPFALGSAVHAQGTKGPSGSGAENASKQSRTPGQSHHDDARTDTRTHSTDDNTSAGTSAHGTPRPGDEGSMTPVAPHEPGTPRTTEPEAGQNRSASGDSSGVDPRGKDDEGFR